MSPGFVWPLQFVFNLASFCNLGDRTAPRAPREGPCPRRDRDSHVATGTRTSARSYVPGRHLFACRYVPRRTACAGLVENSANAPWPPRPRSGQRAQRAAQEPSGGAGPAHAVRTGLRRTTVRAERGTK